MYTLMTKGSSQCHLALLTNDCKLIDKTPAGFLIEELNPGTYYLAVSGAFDDWTYEYRLYFLEYQKGSIAIPGSRTFYLRPRESVPTNFEVKTPGKYTITTSSKTTLHRAVLYALLEKDIRTLAERPINRNQSSFSIDIERELNPGKYYVAVNGTRQAKRGNVTINIKAEIDPYDQGKQAYESGYYSKALQQYRIAADRGNPEALNALGIMYREGQGVRKDFKTAFDLFSQAAAKGLLDAYDNLGIAYRSGQGVPKDNSKALEYFRYAANKGWPWSQFNIGWMYLTGEGVVQNEMEAMGLFTISFNGFKKLAEQGDMNSQFQLGYLYLNGLGPTRNHAEALKWFRSAAEKGEPNAMHYCGYIYYKGLGIQADKQEAVKWFLKAAERGVEAAQLDTANMYYTGEAGTRDYKKALKWYAKASAQGNATATYQIAYFFENGIGVSKSYAEAEVFYRFAEMQGHSKAGEARKRVQNAGPSEECATADRIVVGGWISKFPDGMSRHIYTFQVPSTGEYKIYTTGDPDTVGMLMGSDCRNISSDDNSGSDKNFLIIRTLQPGTYYVAVRGSSVDAAGLYKLHVERIR